MTGEKQSDCEGQTDEWFWLVDDDSLSVGPLLSQLLTAAETPASITGTWFLGRLHPDDKSRHLSEMRRHFSGGEPFACASRIQDMRGRYRWIYLEGRATRDPANRVVRVDGIAQVLAATFNQAGNGSNKAELSIRMTDLLSAGVAALEGREIELARRLLAEENAFSQREFLSTVSHEIRNPLTVIFANISMLRARAERERDNDLLQRLSTLEKSGKHLRDLVSNVLDFAKAEAGHTNAELEWFELGPLLFEIEEMANALASASSVMFLLDTPLDLGRMFGDRLKLKQILLNLVGNAAKFTRNGRITLSVNDENSSLIFAVQDTGPGIPPDRLDSLFKAFSQVGGSSASRSGGTGLGLYISERYVRMLGGRLSVSSQLGKGSTFDFALPRVAASEVDRIPPARREDRLVIGHTEDLGTLDPHMQFRATNAMIARHHFEALTAMTANGNIAPALAESWEPLGQDGWRFRLRRNVRFHDDTEFDAADVVATFDRIRSGPAVGGPFTAFLNAVREVIVHDPFTLDLRTTSISPLLPIDLSNIRIIQRRFAGADTATFDNLTATIGTGPFCLKAKPSGRTLQYQAFAGHWAGASEWRQLDFRLIDESGLASVSALLAGEVDLIDNVGPDQFLELKRRSDVSLATCDSNRIWYLFFDQFRDQSPWITDRSGELLQQNPLKDARVRRAISLAIDREFITQRLMAGQGRPVGDVAGPGVFGVNPALSADPYDPLAARQLLTDAGYPSGFIITLHGSRDRSFHGATTLRAIALMLNAIGIVCRAEALPAAEFYPRAAKGEFSFGLSGWGSVTGETSYSLRMLLCTPEPKTGFGGGNRGCYSNPRVDNLVGEAIQTLDDERRRGLLMQASFVAMAETAIAPICSRTTTWAAKPGIVYEAQADGATLASAVRRAPRNDR